MAREAELERMVVRLIGDDRGLISTLKHAEREVKRVTQNISNKLRGVGSAMKSIGVGMTFRLTAPILGTAAAIFKTSSDFEAEMSKIVGLVGVSEKQVKDWSAELLKLGPSLGKTPTEMAKGLFFVTSAGFRGKEALDVLTMSAKASAGGLGEVEAIADAVTSAVNAYGSENLSASRATDILTATVREGKLEAASITPVMGSLIPTASNLGIAFEDVAGAMAVMSRTGTNAAEGSTSLSAIMSTLLKPTSEATKLLDDAGLSMGDLRKMAAGPGGLIKVMRLLDKTFQDDEEALSKIIPNIRAFRGAMNVLGQKAEVVDGVMDGVRNSTGATDKAFQAASKTGKFAFSQAMATMKAALIDLGNSAMGPMIEVLGWVNVGIQRAIGYWKSLSPTIQKVIVVVALLAATLGPLLIVFGLFVSSVGSIVGFFTMLINPVTIVLGLIVAIGAAVIHFTVGWETALRVVKNFFLTVAGFLYNFRTNMTILTIWFFRNWKTILQDVINLFIASGKLTIDVLSAPFRAFMVIVGNIFTKEMIKFIMSFIRTAGRLIFKFAEFAGKKILAALTGKTGPSLSDLLSGVVNELGQVDTSVVDNTVRDLKKELSPLADPFKDFGVNTKFNPKFVTDLPKNLFGELPKAAEEEAGKTAKKLNQTLDTVPKKVNVKFGVDGIDAVEAGSLAAQLRIREFKAGRIGQSPSASPTKAPSTKSPADKEASKQTQYLKMSSAGINEIVKQMKAGKGFTSSNVEPAGIK